MTEQPTTGNTPDEIPGLDETVPPQERDTRIAADEGDDLPVSPPESQPRATERLMSGMRDGESIEERIAQEVPDPTSAYGAPEDESGLDRPRSRNAAADDSYAGEPAEHAAMHVVGEGEALTGGDDELADPETRALVEALDDNEALDGDDERGEDAPQR